jgi:hypothetical protein
VDKSQDNAGLHTAFNRERAQFSHSVTVSNPSKTATLTYSLHHPGASMFLGRETLQGRSEHVISLPPGGGGYLACFVHKTPELKM